jgi:hypothetical protein
MGPEIKYLHVEKMALAAFHVVQWLQHYIMLRRTTVASTINSFQYILTRKIIGGKYNKWIVLLQEFDLDFASTKSKKYLVFAKLMSEFPVENEEREMTDSFMDEHMFLISLFDPWYQNILIYLQTLKFPPNCSQDE